MLWFYSFLMGHFAEVTSEWKVFLTLLSAIFLLVLSGNLITLRPVFMRSVSRFYRFFYLYCCWFGSFFRCFPLTIITMVDKNNGAYCSCLCFNYNHWHWTCKFTTSSWLYLGMMAGATENNYAQRTMCVWLESVLILFKLNWCGEHGRNAFGCSIDFLSSFVPWWINFTFQLKTSSTNNRRAQLERTVFSFYMLMSLGALTNTIILDRLSWIGRIFLLSRSNSGTTPF